MKVLIGTKNPGKIEGAREAFSKYFNDFEIEGVPVQSNVSDEPVDLDIYKGALNRVNNLIEYSKENSINVDYYCAIESGITNLLGKWIIINIAVIKDKNGTESWGTGPAFPVPDKYVDEIINTELGIVMDRIFEENDLKNGKGGISLLTKDVISRIDITKDAFIMALAGQINEYWK